MIPVLAALGLAFGTIVLATATTKKDCLLGFLVGTVCLTILLVRVFG